MGLVRAVVTDSEMGKMGGGLGKRSDFVGKK